MVASIAVALLWDIVVSFVETRERKIGIESNQCSNTDAISARKRGMQVLKEHL